MPKTTEEIKQRLLAPQGGNLGADVFRGGLSSGSTLINLACSGRPNMAFPVGRYVIYVGSSGAGKTWLALGCLAEAANNKAFDNFRLIYDNGEDGALMDIRRYFGNKTADRLEPPAWADGQPVYSRLAEEMYYYIDDAITVAKKTGRPFIWVEDSLDNLDTKYAGKKFTEAKNAHRGNRKAAGDYGDGKAKINSTHIRKVLAGVRDTGSILMFISQTRDAIDAGMFEPKETYAGGRALKFYAAFEIWTDIARRIRKDVHGNARQVGVTVRVAVKKNRVTGKEWSVEIPILWSTGMDETGSLVDFLVAQKHWKGNKDGQIKADEFKVILDREELIRKIESDGMEKELKLIVTEVWATVEAACAVERKQRYS